MNNYAQNWVRLGSLAETSHFPRKNRRDPGSNLPEAQ